MVGWQAFPDVAEMLGNMQNQVSRSVLLCPARLPCLSYGNHHHQVRREGRDLLAGSLSGKEGGGG